MGAVDDGLFPADPEERGPCRADGMEAVRAVRSPVPRQILDQCAAEKDVDGLEAPADSQNRLFRGGKPLQQKKLRRVPLRLQPPGGGVGLAVPPGLQIAAAGQQQSVTVLREARNFRKERLPPGGLHRPAVIGVPVLCAGNKNLTIHIQPSLSVFL